VSFHLPPDPDEPGDVSALRTSRPSRGRALLLTLVVLAVLIIGFWIFTGFYTDLLWFRSVGFTSVFRKELLTRVLMFVLFGGLMAVAVVVNCWIAYRTRPAFRGMSAEQQGLDRYRVALDPYRRILTIVVAVGLGLVAGASAASEWQTALAFLNSQPFFSSDAQFGVDLSFFMFRLPFWQFLVGFGFGLVVVSLIAAVITHYLYGGLRLQTPGEKTTPAARAHIAVLLGLFVLLKAAAYWFDRYALVVKDGDRISGASYTDVNALLPAKLILFVIAIICALLFFATVVTRNWLAPALGFGLLVLSAIVIGGIYPLFVQSVQVHPSEPDKEAPYIQRNIDATLKAYGLTTVQVKDYAGATDPKSIPASAITGGTVQNVRLVDPAVVSPTFKQLQLNRPFYKVGDPLDVDRYSLSSGEREAVVAVRELDLSGLAAGQHNFANDHTVFTHGFGFIAAYGNSVQSDGSPTFFSYNIPPQGLLKIDQSRVYFGEYSPDYSIVGAPEGADKVEFDYPTDTAGGQGQANYTYQGSGGVAMGSLFGRILFATKFAEPNILLSDRINADSRILWNRDPRDRVTAVAPWLTADGDAYPAVIDGRVVWIVDAYTTNNGYPYSQRTQLGEATTDSLTAASGSAVAAQQSNDVNYIRNSVKATVDAYDGTVTLYAVDDNDPVLKVWESAFPGTVKPSSDIPASLSDHFRYPQDLFKVQRELFAKYHVTDPHAFYGGQDFWKVPDDPTSAGAGSVPQPPYYLTLQMPDQPRATFSLTTTMVPNNRDNLAAFMAVDSEWGADYGTIRVLQLPRSTNVYGPRQVQNAFESDKTIAPTLTLLRQRQSEIIYGNLLSLPIGGANGGLLYVEPVYVRAATGSTYPLLQYVLAGFGNTVAIGEDLKTALAGVFAGTGGGGTTQPPPSGGTTPPPPSGGTDTALQQAVAAAQKALAASDAALRAGDFAAYGEAQKQLADAIAVIARLTAPTASPSPSPTTGATPSPTKTG
jgi:uncharacterized membrane protein (UPF0182 family)